MTTRTIRKESERKEMEKEMLLKVLMTLLRDEENRYCADCESKGPRWASWNIGVFVCIRCAGIHRKLGVHISKVKSINLDGWQAEQVQSMCVMGNSVAKAVYEDSLPSHFRRPQSDQSLEQFIRAKYEHKRYIMKDWSPPKIDITQLPIYDEIMELRTTGIVRVGVRSSASSKSTTNRLPVPAAAKARPPSPNTVAPPSAANDLVDLTLGTPTTTNALFDLAVDTPPPSSVSNGNGLDDLFNDFVSATPSSTLPSANPLGDMNGLASIEPSVTATTPGDSKKTNADIMALFATNGPPQQLGAMPQSQPMQQYQQVNQQLAGLNFGGAPSAHAIAGHNPPQQPMPPMHSFGGGTPTQNAQQLQQQTLNQLMMGTNTGTVDKTDLWR